MIITLSQNNIDKAFLSFFSSHNLTLRLLQTDNQTMYLVLGNTETIDEQSVLSLPYVSHVMRLKTPYKLANRLSKIEPTVIRVGDITIGGPKITFIAGPCSVESKEQMEMISPEIIKSGAVILRAGAFKPRTSPYYFQGLGLEGLKILKNIKGKYNLPIVSEITSIEYLNDFIDCVDIVQVGARNMQNYELLKALGKINKPVLLKRSPSATIEEWLLSAEYILLGGNPNVILCERGIRTFSKMTRSTLDLSSIPLLKKLTHLPIIVDPSHAAGDYSLVESMTYAAIAAGADGIMIEVHDHPEEALSDGNQALRTKKLKAIIDKSRQIAKLFNRDI